jgi:hypothetical protein
MSSAIMRAGRERDILRRRDFAVAEPHQVDGDAAPPMPDSLDDMTPVIAVERHPMDEQCRGSASLIEVGDAAGAHVGEAAVGVKRRDVHETSVDAEAKLGQTVPARW